MDKFVDAHCHFFNSKFLIQESLAMLKNWFRHDYPHVHKAELMPADVAEHRRFNLFKWAYEIGKWIYDISGSIGVGLAYDADGQYSFLEDAAKVVIPDSKDFYAVPLMMDIYYNFDDSLIQRDRAPLLAESEERDGDRQNYSDCLESLISGLTSASSGGNARLRSMEKIRGADVSSEVLDREYVLRIEREMPYPETASGETEMMKAAEAKDEFPQEVESTPGFRSNFLELLAFSRGMRGKARPFLAVDPRRRNVMALVREFVSDTGPFYGIKLYPNLGYRIDLKGNPFWAELFTFCAKNDIPITYHSSYGGFNFPFAADCSDYGNPADWEPVLADYPRLRLNFAHFGGAVLDPGKPGYDWKNTVAGFLRCPNVYTDLSCNDDEERIVAALRLAGDNIGKVMYGTDNPVMYLANFTGINAYNRAFLDAVRRFDASKVESVFSRNALDFLKIDH